MSSRDIEGENPLYLPQAKTYAGSAALGPCLVITDVPPEEDTRIEIEILRGGREPYRLLPGEQVANQQRFSVNRPVSR